MNEHTHLVYGINSHEFAHLDSIWDLAVTVDSHLKFDQRIDHIVHKAMSRAYLILKGFHSRDKSLMVKVYYTYVRPMLKYCFPVWSPHTSCHINRIEKVQRIFTKRIAGLWSVPYDKRLDVLKLLLHSLEYRRISSDLVSCYKIRNGKLDTDLSNVLSSILTRVRVVMLLSCTNSDAISTVLSIILLIVLLICGTIYRKTW